SKIPSFIQSFVHSSFLSLLNHMLCAFTGLIPQVIDWLYPVCPYTHRHTHTHTHTHIHTRTHTHTHSHTRQEKTQHSHTHIHTDTHTHTHTHPTLARHTTHSLL